MVYATESAPIMSKAGFKTVGIGSNIRSILLNASGEDRIVAGITNAIRSLAEDANNFLFCFIAPSKLHDSAAHMQEVLLEAFCFENDIYIIKVDSAQKLSRLLGSSDLASCALVRKSSFDGADNFSRSENILIDHCEFYWDEPAKPVIKLPEK